MSMSGQDELILEYFSIEPRNYISYLDEDLYAHIEFRNASERMLEISKITCSFQVEESLPRCKAYIEPHMSIRPWQSISLP